MLQEPSSFRTDKILVNSKKKNWNKLYLKIQWIATLNKNSTDQTDLIEYFNMPVRKCHINAIILANQKRITRVPPTNQNLGFAWNLKSALRADFGTHVVKRNQLYVFFLTISYIFFALWPWCIIKDTNGRSFFVKKEKKQRGYSQALKLQIQRKCIKTTTLSLQKEQ